MQGKIHIIKAEFGKSSTVFNQVLKLYEKWKHNTYHEFSPLHQKHEFLHDDYIFTKASYAETLMALGSFAEAIQKFEQAKK
jgi:hypothetical protein